jgi:hypothetical protein
MRRTILSVASVLVLGITPSVALADSPSEGGYNSTPIVVPASAVNGASAQNSTPAATPAATPTAAVTKTKTVSSSSLPFTGLDVGLMALVAAGLLGLGFALRRVPGSRDD